ncbi:hypothetical protein [Neorhizobium galegae]|uniref:hypothetical protein n=1 Tax=Neorhizobium galegae TaxID=399 RepID=UPI001F1A5B37|nr:hypothetical protein [Neorhizobium galegae]UIK05019.1 hypothetical protein LZK81_20580 [Neorhizobium galegae]
MNNELQEQLIGEIIGLRAVVQAVLGGAAVLAGPGSNFLEVVNKTAHDKIHKDEIQAPGLDNVAIKARAERTIDIIFTTLNVDFPKK